MLLKNFDSRSEKTNLFCFWDGKREFLEHNIVAYVKKNEWKFFVVDKSD